MSELPEEFTEELSSETRQMLEWIRDNDEDLGPIAEAILQEELDEEDEESSSIAEVSAA